MKNLFSLQPVWQIINQILLSKIHHHKKLAQLSLSPEIIYYKIIPLGEKAQTQFFLRILTLTIFFANERGIDQPKFPHYLIIDHLMQTPEI